MNHLRQPIIAGNWKMNIPADFQNFIAGISKNTAKNASLVICPPFSHLGSVAAQNNHRNFQVGAQNVHHENSGAYTGEVSASMLASVGVQYVIIGHSERRQYQAEGHEVLAPKLQRVLEQNMIGIYCVGETLEERKSGRFLEVIDQQLKTIPKDFPAENLVIAYEPVWAIGTGETASPEQANEVHAHIRNFLKMTFGEDFANSIRILYGGSMKPSNAAELLAQPEVDGGLIGGASLVLEDFLAIAAAADNQ
ncbi:MAG: triose-phosphate isomerase [Flavobacteriales bacterium]|nr:MAG: triose-phosphate isomerase [Flavobacteriales bacterium]